MKKLFIYFSFASIYAQAQTLSLKEVIVQVQQQHPELKMYESQAKAYDAMAEGATAWEAPQLSAGLFMTPYQTSYWKDRRETIDGMPTMMQGMGNVMIQARQMIPNPSKLNAGKKYQLALASVELENKKVAANELVFQTKTAYYESQILARKLKVLQEAQATVNTMVQLGEKKIAYNQESLVSVYKAKSQEALLSKDQWMMESEQKQKRYLLNGLMNRSKEELFELDTTLIIQEYEQVTVDSSTVVASRSDMIAIDKSIQVALLKQKSEQRQSRPDFGIEYGHMFVFGSNPNMFTLMGMMSVPIAPWSSKMYKSNIRASQWEVEAMQHQKEALVIESLSMLKGMKSEIASAKYQLKLYKEMVLPSLQKAYDVAMLAYANNTGELFMALDARMNLQMAQMQYWDTMLNLLKLQANYEKQAQIF